MVQINPFCDLIKAPEAPNISYHSVLLAEADRAAAFFQIF
jgi:hypothetical protein